MKAVVVREFGGPEVLRVEELPQLVPARGQVLVRVLAAGVNPVDTYLRSGKYPNPPKLPFTPGKDAAGIIESVGQGVDHFSSGDRIFTADSLTGTYAEFALCSKSQVAKLPDNIGFEAGAGVWTPYATAYRALFEKAKVASGETLLVHGASGGVGLACVQWAKHAGLAVIGTAGSDEGKLLVSEQGADLVVDHLSDSPEQSSVAKAKILEATGGRGVDVIVEMLADKNLSVDFDVLAKFGRISIIGSRGSLEFAPRLAMTKDASIFGLSLFNAPADALNRIRAAIVSGLEQGFLRPVVGRSYSLSDVGSAHLDILKNKAAGKIVLTP